MITGKNNTKNENSANESDEKSNNKINMEQFKKMLLDAYKNGFRDAIETLSVAYDAIENKNK